MSKPKKPNYTLIQPIEGETVAYCVHEAIRVGSWKGSAADARRLGPNTNPDKMHFFFGKFAFRRPDGTEGKTSWAIVCDECYENHKAGQEFLIGGDGTWKGNAPTIRSRGGEV
jgi:hypothetical protein